MRLTEIRKFFSFMFFLLATTSLVLVGCKEDEDDIDPMSPTGSITVSNQTLINDMISIDNVTMSQPGWVVVHASNAAGDGPQVPEIISTPVLVEAGSNADVMVTLTNLDGIDDGSKVWVMLHTDNGSIGSYEFDGANGFDGPILDESGAIVVKPITLTVQVDEPTGMFTAVDQTISQNMIKVGSVNMSASGWIVVHASNAAGDGPQVPEIISEPLLVDAGISTDVMLSLSEGVSISSGDKVWIMLHTDNGTLGSYEFDGANGFDGPIFDENDNIVVKPIIITAPSITVSDQVVSENMIVIEEVNAAVDGWMVIHADNGGSPGAVLGQTMVTAGSNTDVMVDLGDATFGGGELLFPMLHIESPADGVYGFPDNGDGPEVFGSDVIVVSFETNAPTGTITVADQAVDANTITVDNLTVNATAWVVVHASNETNDGPEVPGIISEPVQLTAGSNDNVEITLTEATAAGDVLYVMIHTDNGVIGDYEFDGASGFDAPVNTESFTVSGTTGSITVNDQPINANTITASNLTVNAAAWVVVHASNATNDGPEVPGIISEPVALSEGSNDDVVITLTETVEAGETLYVMLHTDNGTIGSYEFDGSNGLDAPIITQSITVSANTGSITANDQIIQGNTITASALTLNASGWVVVHASNATNDGPEVPGIISVPVEVAAGTNNDVAIELTENVASGATLYVMLHTDNGTIGSYEFDGANGFDGPITTQAITALAPTGSFTANDQEVSGTTLNVASITVGQPSWVVVHKDDGTGTSFVAPGIISTPVALQAGTSTDVSVTLTEAVTDGERLWIMLHNDNGVVGNYEFDGSANLDSPITFSSIDVTVPATATNYDVTNDGASAYLYSGNGLSSASNAAITLTRGETYTFTIDAPGHPFYINSTQGTGTGNAFNDGVTNNGTQSGTITFTVPAGAPNTLFYNCEFHGGMTGTFTIVD